MRGVGARIAAAIGAGSLVMAFAVGCGGDKNAACKDMRQVVLGFGRQQSGGAKELVQAYSAAAEQMRRGARASGDGKVEAAAEKVAAAFEGLARELRGVRVEGVGVPDTAALTSANAELRKACGI
jgi:hypothetical protein